MVSLGYDAVGLSKEIGLDSTTGLIVREKESGPSGEFCRICRDKSHTEEEEQRIQLGRQGGLKAGRAVATAGAGAGADMEVVAVPFVFRLLLSELAAMGISVQVGVD
jgi:DNA-directed RNA polymerase I subunit RPA2